MRTLHVDSGREMRGGQWQALYLVERLSDAVLLARPGSPLYREAARRNIDVRALTLRALVSGAKQADLVHVHDARSHTLAAMAGVAPLVVARRVAFPLKRGFFSLWKYAQAALYIAVSKHVAALLIDAGIRAAKVRVIHDGVPIPAPAQRESGRVVALASKPVTLPGISVDLTSELWQDLSRASIFVYKSEMEGLGSGVLAAMAAGVPVVASRVGGIAEAVETGKTGFLVEDGDFATPVRRLLEDQELAAEMSRAARERAQRDFSVEGMVEKTVRAYGELST